VTGSRQVHEGDARPIEAWTADEIRRVGREVVDLIADHLAGVAERPLARPVPRPVAASLSTTALPRAATAPDRMVAEVRDLVFPYPLGNNHPRFWAWVCAPTTVMGVFGEALAATLDPHCDVGEHAAIHLERGVVGWFRDLVGYPATAAGLLVSGGSMANLTGIAAARSALAGRDIRRAGLQDGGPRMVGYVSEEGHSCLRKSFELLGLGSDNLRSIPSGPDFRIRLDLLVDRIERDRAAGLRPFVVIGNAGSTNTGAIDPLADLAAVTRRFGLWFHVDGAYGAPAILTDRYRAALEPLALADSLAVDPHKWLQAPVEAGVALVRDAAALRAAFSLVPAYLREGRDDVDDPRADLEPGAGDDGHGPGHDAPSFAELGFQQTRGFRALKLWLGLRELGLDRIAHLIASNIATAERVARRVEEASDLELLGGPSLSVVCFRYLPRHDRAGTTSAEIDALNRAIVRRIQRGGDAYLAETRVRGRVALRVCIVNGGARPSDADRVVALVRREGRALARVRGREAADLEAASA
jgi:aromatic-L-amino-acid decarboxylase